MNYDVIIGLELHVEINTRSKAFCSCPNNPFQSKPNTLVCPTCLGHPGTIPLINQKAIDKVIQLGLALNCQINKNTKFDRKNYFYPDLPKGYQISQNDCPLAFGGFLEVNQQKIEITRIHLEEDSAKLTHPLGKSYTLIDFNRAGVPLLELVTEPMIKDAYTAKAFAQTLQQILRYLNISEANMEKGQMRCEANVSLQEKKSWYREKGRINTLKNKKINNKVELKNINSFRSLEKSILYEIKRQEGLLLAKKEILGETRGYDEKKNKTFHQRIKKSRPDYRSLPENDISPLKISSQKIALLNSSLGELPHKKKLRFIQEYGLSPEMAEVLTEDKEIANWLEMVLSELQEWLSVDSVSWENQKKQLSRLTANWLTSQLFKYLKEDKKSIREIKISAENFAELISLIHKEKVNSRNAQKILAIMYKNNENPTNIMNEHHLGQEEMGDQDDFKEMVKKIIEKYPQQLYEYIDGKEALLQFFIGKVMAETKGKYRPQDIIKTIKNYKK